MVPAENSTGVDMVLLTERILKTQLLLAPNVAQSSWNRQELHLKAQDTFRHPFTLAIKLMYFPDVFNASDH